MKTTVRWCDWEMQGLEFCTLIQEPNMLLLEGVVVGTRESRYGAYYRVQADSEFRTRKVDFSYVGGSTLHVESDGNGHWTDTVNNTPIVSLEGCFDVDIGVTPATNMLPIKRLGLAENESRHIRAAYIPLPSQIDGAFLPRSVEQRYTCLKADKRYRYEGIFRDFSAELEFDENGLVIDYPDTFRRVGT
ncbi:putative glycolipid-binding domain-containing protein [cf. Phormidesmis sp. LEGE 11477]|uniref:putative glycolipid-binding domain-containing protein n=1 Tax=cf. Phormidesmis sp. LEGE 11477 TaxID=1828680 RepID=UPI001880A57F|nr:putative glycolipid-binding domain-containing protein [cf. Phormidesmis sp. LEGE 11477]MBE9061094.1 putative glycolipid-binding domain-containing protein [cf. Phormidesmis sp. LEGE 11477]